jgi:hypothetical protein
MKSEGDGVKRNACNCLLLSTLTKSMHYRKITFCLYNDLQSKRRVHFVLIQVASVLQMEVVRVTWIFLHNQLLTLWY